MADESWRPDTAARRRSPGAKRKKTGARHKERDGAPVLPKNSAKEPAEIAAARLIGITENVSTRFRSSGTGSPAATG